MFVDFRDSTGKSSITHGGLYILSAYTATDLVVCVICSFVTDSVCAVTISLVLFILPSRKPNYLCFRKPNGSSVYY